MQAGGFPIAALGSDARAREQWFDGYESLAPFGVVLHDGAETLRLAERVVAVPLSVLWEG